MEIKIVKKEQPISREELGQIARKMFGDFLLVKAVVDVEQEVMAINGEFHADEEVVLIENYGSKREYTWGVNLYSEKIGREGWIEFDSVVNLKPAFGNRTRGVDNPEIREKIIRIVTMLVK